MMGRVVQKDELGRPMFQVSLTDELEAIDSTAERNRALSVAVSGLSRAKLVSEEVDGEIVKLDLGMGCDMSDQPTIERPLPRIFVTATITLRDAAFGPLAVEGKDVVVGFLFEGHAEVTYDLASLIAEDTGERTDTELPDIVGAFLSTLEPDDDADDDESCDGRSGDGAGRPVRPGLDS